MKTESAKDAVRKGSKKAADTPPPSVPEYIQQGRIYQTDDLSRILNVSRHTIQKWTTKVDNPLPFRQPDTKSKLFLGDHIIAWIFGPASKDNERMAEAN